MEGTRGRAIALAIAGVVLSFCSRPLPAQSASASDPSAPPAAPSSSVPASPPASSFESEPAFGPPESGSTSGLSPAGPPSPPPDEPGPLAIAFWTGAVLLAFAAGTTALKRWWPGARRLFPSEAIRVLGRRALTPAHTLYLVEIGHRILRVGCTKDGITYLGEIADRDEVALVKAQATAGAKESESRSFRQALDGTLRDSSRTETAVSREEAVASDPLLPDPATEPGPAELKEELTQIRRTIEGWRG
ncbi:MAG: flagellar biosynthetic protein FliO [Planctomycetes bacterium]|nr:flagellar biosynthetic protein FliO [Planctomycetota bacterium]